MLGSPLVVRLVSAVIAAVMSSGAPPAGRAVGTSRRDVSEASVAVRAVVPPAIPRHDAGPVSPGLSIQAPNSWSAVVSWTAVDGADRYQILREGRLIDDFPAGPDTSYTDYLLWQSTTYTYELKALDAAGEVLADLSAGVTTPVQEGSFPRFYSDSSFWNTPIGSSPKVDANSRNMILTSISAYRGLAVVNKGDDWGIPLAYASPHSQTYTIGCVKYGCNTTVQFRIPRYATPNTEWDGHLAVYDPSTNQQLDLWQGVYDPGANAWTAGSRFATTADWGAGCAPGTRCGGGGTAAGFLEFGGVIRPEEIAQGHIDHALVIAAPYIRADYIACPATNYWASEDPQYQADPDAIPLGARIQMDPHVDVDAKPWPQWEKVVARALQTYGAYVTDVSGSLELRGEASLDRGYDAWVLVGMPGPPKPSLVDLPWKRFRVLAMTSC